MGKYFNGKMEVFVFKLSCGENHTDFLTNPNLKLFLITVPYNLDLLIIQSILVIL